MPRHYISWLAASPHIRDETYRAALAELVNAQFRHPFAGHWGDGTTSSSDGQNFHAARPRHRPSIRNTAAAQADVHTHISDQYAPFHTRS
ncbi:Tn3 family transposase [Klebsiella pneumoniae]|uniref:Tn3 family transposase n=1 Tax=Klebsiella pneumoniae TaxID=573 RepID=UPI00396F4C8D